ncbi:NAD-specific glutamate dehydrogenase large form [Vibrio astriarenae]|nr:NAD-specific glutamate dehydrogenase large form [Vibrio sp. C7]
MPASDTPLVTQLAEHLFSNVSHDDLIHRNESDLYGAVLSLWHHLGEKNAQDISVRVFNQPLAVAAGSQRIRLLK